MKRYKWKNKKGITFPNFESVIRPIPHNSELPVPKPPDCLDDIVLETDEIEN